MGNREQGEAAKEGRLTARPHERADASLAPGLHEIGRGDPDDVLLYVPRSDRPDQRHPLVLTLHGAGGSPRAALDLLLPLADEARMALLAPKSRGSTWDVIVGGYGPDVSMIDNALTDTFARCSVDPRRVAIGGFSDGASYALSLGLGNGDLFRAILAFSPGFSAPPTRCGSPAVFVSHGTNDAVLPIDVTSRRVVRELRNKGYEVHYREFAGPHTVPPAIAREAVEWFRTAELSA